MRNEDEQGSLPNHRPEAPKGPRFISDIKRPNEPHRQFPPIGATLPTYRHPARTVPDKPQASNLGLRLPNPEQTASHSIPNTAQIPKHAPPKVKLKKPKFKWLKPRLNKKRIAIIIILIILATAGWLGGKFIINTLKIFQGNIFGILNSTKLRGEDQGRVNILLAGNSADDPGHDGATLTDSIMIVSIDTKNKTGYMLSIPRDLWVEIPGNGHAKINEAYVDGESSGFNEVGYFKGGMGLLQQVVEQNIGVKADYYALVNYNAFKDAVDAVGGIDVNIHSDDPRGLYDPSIDWVTHGPMVRLTNGPHTLDGPEALNLARARGDAYGSYGFAESDFDRTSNQRMMLLALKNKALSTNVLANPLKLSNLFDALGKNVRTDFSLSEARRLYDLMKEINNTSIQSVSFNDADGANLLSNYTTPIGQSALRPAAGIDNYSAIKKFVAKLSSNNTLLKEGARVVVLNATDSYGVAAKSSEYLATKDINVIAIGDAKSPSTNTYIINAAGNSKPESLKLLQSIYGNHVTTTNPYADIYNADYIIVVGTNFKLPTDKDNSN